MGPCSFVRSLLDEQFDMLSLKQSRLGRVLRQTVEIGTLDGIFSRLETLKASVPHRFRSTDSFPNVYCLEHWMLYRRKLQVKVETVVFADAVRPSKGDGLRLYDFAAAQAGRAHADALRPAFYFGADRSQIDVPAPLGHVVGVADVVSELRPLAADRANLCHDCSEEI